MSWSAQAHLAILLLTAQSISVSQATCPSKTHLDKLEFNLLRTCQLSEMPAIAFKNTVTLEDCVRAAKRGRGLALNFGPASRAGQKLKGSEVFELLLSDKHLEEITRPNVSRNNENHQSVWKRPQQYFNCHILACPENSTMRSLVNDSRYDYYSLYGEPVASLNYTCVPQVGLFQLQTTAVNFRNATNFCQNTTSIGGVALLAHVASAVRTDSFTKLLQHHNEHAREVHARQHTRAYVGLYFNRSYISEPIEYVNSEKESLRCFEFAAWAPGHPRTTGDFANLSCVAITNQNTWMTVDCEIELPYICEIYISRSDLNETTLTAGTCSPGAYEPDL